MRILHVCFLAVLALACGLQADAARRTDAATGRIALLSPPMIGHLEMTWGDPGPALRAAGYTASRFNVSLLDGDGVRHLLDPDQALHAAEDLYALAGRRVAVSTVVATTKAGAGQSERIIDAIVPVDDIFAAPGQRQLAPRRTVAASVVKKWVTLLCKFSDKPNEPKALDYYQSQYGTSLRMLDHYWQEVSYGQINLAGSKAYNWRTLPQPRAYYVTKNTSGVETADLNKLYDDCVAVHDPGVDFAANGGVQGINMAFNDELDGYPWGGSHTSTLDGSNASRGVTWLPPWGAENLATMVHEMGHGFGLPHANNSDGDSSPYDNTWDVMSDTWSNASYDPAYGALPKHLNIYSRNRLGWVTTERKRTVVADGSTVTLTLDRASLPGSGNTQMVILSYPNQSLYYYTVEVRKRVGEYEKALAGDAVIIHHVMPSRRQPSWSMDADRPPADLSNNEGTMFKVGETWISRDLAFQVKVESATAEGFVVKVTSTRSRIKGGPGQSQQSSATTKPTSTAVPTHRPDVTRGSDRTGRRR